MTTEYRIWTMADLLAVPCELRDTRLKEIGYALALHELAWGDKAAENLKACVWRDDGIREYTLEGPNGEPGLKMTIRDKEPDEYELTPEGRAIAAAYKKRQEQAK